MSDLALLGADPAFADGVPFVRPAVPAFDRVAARVAPSYDRGMLTNGPLVDTTIAIARRLRAHRPVFTGDRSHVYDQLVDRGLSTGWVTAAFAALQALLTLIGVAVMQLDSAWAFASAGVVVVLLAVAAAMGGFVTATTQGSTT